MIRELFENSDKVLGSSEGVVAKLLRERKELNKEMRQNLLKNANRDEQQQAAAAIASIGVGKLKDYLAEKKYQRAKEEGNAEEVDPDRYAAEVQDSVFQRFNQLRKGQFIDYDSLENDTLNYMKEGGDKQRILDLIDIDRNINRLDKDGRDALLEKPDYDPSLDKLQRRINKLYDPDTNPDYEINKTLFEKNLAAKELEAAKNSEQQNQGMVTQIVDNNTATTPDNNDKKDKDKKKGLFGFFS